MELRLFWRIVKRRLWVVLVLLLAFALSYVVAGPESSTSFVATMRYTIGIRPEQASEEYYGYDRYYTWLTAEYLIDDFAEVAKSRVFAQDVAKVSGLSIPPGVIQGATSAGKLHRILSIQAVWHDPDELAQIAGAIAQVVRDRTPTYFSQLGTESAVVSLIDPPSIAPIGPSLRQRLDLPLRLILSLLVGIGLTFVLDYLDDSIRDRDDVQDLELSVFGEIPTRHGWLVRLFGRHPSA